MNVYLDTLGCRLNEAELAIWARGFQAAGHRVVTDPAQADVCVLNSCAVTGEAARKSRQATRRLHRINPRARLVLTGCYAQLEPDAGSTLPGVELLIGNRDKDRLVELVLEIFDGVGITPSVNDDLHSLYLYPGSRTRAFVKVQDGCNNHCTFCVVTVARGEERSRPLGEVVTEINQLVEAGYREVVLTGVHLGGYGCDLGTNLYALVQAVLTRTGIQRLRLSSLEPWDLEEDFFSLWRDPRLCPHLHLPLQSGCDATLHRMGRRYDTKAYARLVAQARAAIPDLIVTTDVIVGFPGETDAEFTTSLRFVEQMRFAHIHVFPYSRREGTAAAWMGGHVADAVKRARVVAMQELDQRSGHAERSRFLGTVRPVLWEQSKPLTDGQRRWSGLTDNYLRVYADVSESENLTNHITFTRLVALEGNKLRGEIA
ncbi:MAG TPA: tRNA (N(6)-L-threonylcarbamoyladenosine(37)-C(2))-methylthiotransferase MtaB [Anaerolineae bacterium]|nr:tRNA (N(6)-L-threonylcarbamoyladenosine(37)-C(2))-methylthiotransferase MtaB [Anaerolineae bacterium]